MAPPWLSLALPLATALWLVNVHSATAISAASESPSPLPSHLLAADAEATYVHRQTDGFFGYSLATYVDQGFSYVTVGAPRDRVGGWSDEGGDRRIGRAYRCGQRPGEAWSCEQTPSATRSSQREEYRSYGHVEPSVRASQWMGATVAATSVGRDGYFAACAPRFVSKLGAQAGEMWSAIGECLVYPGMNHHYHVISPCNSTGGVASSGRGADLGQCLGGFSASVLGYQDGADSVLYFAAGLPGCYDSNGELFVGRFVNRNFTGGWTYHRQSGVERLLTGRTRSLYLGYSVRLASLRPLPPPQQPGRRRIPAVDLLASRPVWAEADWKGAVTVMDIFMTTELHVKDTRGRIGDYFGYSLATADLDGDGIGDIAVGAPFFSNSSESRVNSGRVYVYYGQYTDGRYSVRPEPIVLEAAAWKTGHFGHAVAAIGDVDDDGLDDLAVGCPYCGAGRNGEVHLFLSRRGGRLRREPQQVLRAESHPLDSGGFLKQFGWSLSGGVDFDGNGYPDLVIGSHTSAAITLYKTRPVVRFSVSTRDLQAPALVDARRCSSSGGGGGSASDDCLVRLGGSFHLLCGDRRSSAAIDELDVDLELDLDSRTSAAGKRLRSVKLNRSVTARRERLRCNASFTFQDVAEILPAPAQADLVTPIVARLRLKPAWPQAISGAPALHPDSDIVTDFPRIEVLKPECGSDNVCQPELRLHLAGTKDEGTGDGIVFYGDQRTLLRVVATVENSGEAAHEAVLRFRLPGQVAVQWPVEAAVAGAGDWQDPAWGLAAAGVQCNEETGASSGSARVLTCLLGRQLPPGRALTVSVSLLIDGLIESGWGPNFTITADVSSQEAVEEGKTDAPGAGSTAVASASFAVFVRADLELKGMGPNRDSAVDARPEAVAAHAGKRYRVETLGVHFNHSYDLFNTGPSPLHDINVKLTVPLDTESGDTLVYLLDRLTRVSVDGLRETFTAAPRVLEASANREKAGAWCSYAGLNRLNLTFWRDEARPTREKRSASAVSAPRNESDDEAMARSLPLEPIQCGGGKVSEAFGRVRCAVVRCRIGRLRAMEKVRIVFDGLLWAETLFSYRVPAVHLQTTAVAEAGPQPYRLRTHDLGKKAIDGGSTPVTVEQSFFFKGVKPRPASKAPLWAIVVAVLLGLLLLALIIICLWRCGFFQRRRWFVDKPVQL